MSQTLYVTKKLHAYRVVKSKLVIDYICNKCTNPVA